MFYCKCKKKEYPNENKNVNKRISTDKQKYKQRNFQMQTKEYPNLNFYSKEIHQMYFSLRKITLQFVSGFYIFIRCHELSFENSLTALWLFMSTLHTVQAVVVSLMHSPMKNFCINNFVCKTLSCLCKMQLCSDFEYHNKTSFPHRNKKYCLKKNKKNKTFLFKIM